MKRKAKSSKFGVGFARSGLYMVQPSAARYSVWTAVVVALMIGVIGGCAGGPARTGGGDWQPPRYEQQAIEWSRQMARLDWIKSPASACWLLEVYWETCDGVVWIGEVEGGKLCVHRVACSFEPFAVRELECRTYADFDEFRERAVGRIFSAPNAYELAPGQWRGGCAFAGRGKSFVQTYVPLPGAEMDKIELRLSVPAGETQEPEVEESWRVPIECAMPWIVSKFYPAQ